MNSNDSFRDIVERNDVVDDAGQVEEITTAMERLPDETDGCFGFSKKDETERLLPLGPTMQAEEYFMDHPRRGKAVIFNHKTFQDRKVSKRKGAEADERNLKHTFEKLGFQVMVCNDYKLVKIYNTLNEIANEDHSDADCLVIVAMTHGKPGILHAYDDSYKENKLWEPFCGSKCPSLAGKPKIFFIQACRGQRTDSGQNISVRLPRSLQTQTDSGSTPTVTYTIPNTADLLIAHATFDGYYAWRNADTGSWFIQALCQELNDKGTTHDLVRIMTTVNRKVAIEYVSYATSKEMDKKKQMSTFISTLTRMIYFRSKNKRRPSRDNKHNILGSVPN